jgi:hypothetical protein
MGKCDNRCNSGGNGTQTDKGRRKEDAMKTTNTPVQINNALLNTITPMGGLDFQRNKIYASENVAKVYAITKYP